MRNIMSSSLTKGRIFFNSRIKDVYYNLYTCAHSRNLHTPMHILPHPTYTCSYKFKAKFKKHLEKRRNKEKVGVRICWMNQQINIITSSLIFLKAFTSSISCLINLFLFLLFALCLHWIIKQHKNYSTAKRNQKYSRLLLRKEITY